MAVDGLNCYVFVDSQLITIYGTYKRLPQKNTNFSSQEYTYHIVKRKTTAIFNILYYTTLLNI